jgi:hypothetical protein
MSNPAVTRLLQDSLGGSANHALMICCISSVASFASETCQSLSYASKVTPPLRPISYQTMPSPPLPCETPVLYPP